MIQRMSYKDIPEQDRKQSGMLRLSQLKMSLADRTLPVSQREVVENEVVHINSWMAGTLPTPNVAPKQIEVRVEEDIRIAEDL